MQVEIVFFAPVVDSTIGKFILKVVNSSKQMIMSADEATAAFITGWIFPKVQELARSQVRNESPTEAATSESIPTPLAKFNFPPSETADIPDKVKWNPTKHEWTLNLKKRKEFHSMPLLKVDPSLEAAMYEQEKLAAYRSAISAWNSLDGSSRPNIPEPWLLSEPAASC